MNETLVIRIRYWASARAAAGVAEDELITQSPVTLADVRRHALDLHPGTRLPEVLAVCSVLVGDLPVASEDPASVEVLPGQSVEFLPPFAGG